MTFNTYTVKQLKQIIKEYNIHHHIRGYSKMRKADLIKNMSDHLHIKDDKIHVKDNKSKTIDVPKQQPTKEVKIDVNELHKKYRKAINGLQYISNGRFIDKMNKKHGKTIFDNNESMVYIKLLEDEYDRIYLLFKEIMVETPIFMKQLFAKTKQISMGTHKKEWDIIKTFRNKKWRTYGIHFFPMKTIDEKNHIFENYKNSMISCNLYNDVHRFVDLNYVTTEH